MSKFNTTIWSGLLTPAAWFSPKVSVDQRLHWIDVWMKKGEGKWESLHSFRERNV